MVANKTNNNLKILKQYLPFFIIGFLILLAVIYLLIRISEDNYLAELEQLYETQQCDALQEKLSSYKQDENAKRVYELSYECSLQTNNWGIAQERSKIMLDLDTENKDIWQERLSRADYELSVQIDREKFNNLEIKGQDSADELL